MIIHADMDAFYASVELLERPDLAGKPVAVGGPSRSRGVISAANYVAREFGVHSALPTSIAVKRCPDLVLMKPRMSLYAEYSRKIKAIFRRYTPTIEPLALDEAFLDPAGSEKLFGDAETIGRYIKKDIKTELGLTVSVGIAKNKFVAKIASDIDKPDGLVVVPAAQTQSFLDPLPITRIWGIGKVAANHLHQRGIHTIEQLRCVTNENMIEWFGKQAIHLLELANGIDNRRVITDHEAKSISHENTFDHDLVDVEAIQAQLLHLTEMVSARLRHGNITGKTVTVKVRFSSFRTITRSHTLPHCTHETGEIWNTIKHRLLPKIELDGKRIRLLGVGISQLSQDNYGHPDQLDMFAHPPRNNKIDKITDEINSRFGPSTLKRGTSTLIQGSVSSPKNINQHTRLQNKKNRVLHLNTKPLK